jgi:addiction module RelE/StbE family toxin
MVKYSLRIYPKAKKDLEDIFSYISTELLNYKAALDLIKKFEEALNNICYFPELCPLIDNEFVKDNTIRRLVVNNYNVFYRFINNEIQVVRVLSSMNNYFKLY